MDMVETVIDIAQKQGENNLYKSHAAYRKIGSVSAHQLQVPYEYKYLSKTFTTKLLNSILCPHRYKYPMNTKYQKPVIQLVCERSCKLQ